MLPPNAGRSSKLVETMFTTSVQQRSGLASLEQAAVTPKPVAPEDPRRYWRTGERNGRATQKGQRRECAKGRWPVRNVGPRDAAGVNVSERVGGLIV